MKADISAHKLKLAGQAETTIPTVLTTYEPGDLSALGAICHSITTLAEFYADPAASEHASRVPRLIDYLRGKFGDCVVLVLRDGEKHYGYTAQNITKFVRGENVHGASDLTATKRRVLHEYVFEADTGIECEFQISWNWIAGPNLRADSGNFDTGSAFVHSISLNGRRIEAGQVESSILAIAYEFWQANTSADPAASAKVFIKFDPGDYEHLWGTELTDRVRASLVTYHGISDFGEDTPAESES